MYLSRSAQESLSVLFVESGFQLYGAHISSQPLKHAAIFLEEPSSCFAFTDAISDVAYAQLHIVSLHFGTPATVEEITVSGSYMQLLQTVSVATLARYSRNSQGTQSPSQFPTWFCSVS